MVTNLEQLNELLSQRTDLPQHRRHVSPSLNNLSWLKKNIKGGELGRLVALGTDQFKKPYEKPAP